MMSLSSQELSQLLEASILLSKENNGGHSSEERLLSRSRLLSTLRASTNDKEVKPVILHLQRTGDCAISFNVPHVGKRKKDLQSLGNVDEMVDTLFDLYPTCRKSGVDEAESDSEDEHDDCPKNEILEVLTASQKEKPASSQLPSQKQPSLPATQPSHNPYARRPGPVSGQPLPPNQNSQLFHNPYGSPPEDNTWEARTNPFRAASEWTSQDAKPPEAQPMIRDSLKRKFQPPVKKAAAEHSQTGQFPKKRGLAGGARPNQGKPQSNGSSATKGPTDADDGDGDELPEELSHLEVKLVRKIESEIMHIGDPVTFDDIAGLHDAKQTVQEVVCWPMKRPDLFTGLRAAPNGLLLYGPPGTGKTLIGKAIAHESGATFFSISSSSLTSKWSGEAEKLVRTLFAVAAYRQPAVVFIDEIDSLLTQRSADEAESSRRIKTEFLVQLDGTGTSCQGRVLTIGATNRPQELDEAARRRFTKRLYIPLPETADREALLNVLLAKNHHVLSPQDVSALAGDTKGFSGADLKALSTDAAMGPLRELGSHALDDVQVEKIPPIAYKHFRKALKSMRPSVAAADIVQYIEWDKTYGTKRATEDEGVDD